MEVNWRNVIVSYHTMLVLIVLETAASPQITMSREWVRGRYPGDNKKGDDSSETEKISIQRRSSPRNEKLSIDLYPQFLTIRWSAQVAAKIVTKILEPELAAFLTPPSITVLARIIRCVVAIYKLFASQLKWARKREIK